MPRPLLYAIGTFFWTGYAPIAPATVASFGVTVLWWLSWTWLGPIPLWLNAVLLAAVTAIGIPVATRLEKIHGEDPSLVVIDEVAGMLVTYLGVSTGPLGWLAGFFWFRFFDIFKPLGIRKLEKLGGGLGIMVDDLGAGVLACAATHATIILLGWGT
ncbi:MAG: phosphatidylglycerophosphatase A [Gemmatimonadales bacterium]|nr:phosphatidylglycerophosphatase A [Gemmatimonadales bacterium]